MIYQCSPAVASTLQAVYPYLHEKLLTKRKKALQQHEADTIKFPKLKAVTVKSVL